MKIVHAVQQNNSGMHRLAQNCVEGEKRLGIDSMLIDCHEMGQWMLPQVVNADLYVNHSAFPKDARMLIERAQGKRAKTVFVSHGIPEYTMELSIASYEANAKNPHAYAFDDYWAALRYWLKESDATVVFSERQQAIYQTFVGRNDTIDCVPMGIDRAFWETEVPTEGLIGSPVVWMSENQNRVKWALDVLTAWPWVVEQCPEIHLHCHWMPLDFHRFFIDLANTNGASYHATLSSLHFSHERLRNLWKAVHFILSPTRYGDNTLVVMEANAAGVPVVTYPGNAYADYWIQEGDQRKMAKELVAIFKGEVTPREKLPAPDLMDMSREMVAVYARVLGVPVTQSVAPPRPNLALMMDEPVEVAV